MSQDEILFFWTWIFLILPARDPNTGSEGAEGDSRQAALEVQELCWAHHNEGPGGSQRPSQGGTFTHTHHFSDHKDMGTKVLFQFLYDPHLSMNDNIPALSIILNCNIYNYYY